MTAAGRPVIDLTCGASATVLGHVRTLIGFRFSDWGLKEAECGEARETLLLIAAELISNAVHETPGRGIRIHCVFEAERRLIRFGVWDSSPRMPLAQMPELTLETLDLSEENADANGGWGLPLVVALSAATGVNETAAPAGKWVWSEVKL